MVHAWARLRQLGITNGSGFRRSMTVRRFTWPIESDVGGFTFPFLTMADRRSEAVAYSVWLYLSIKPR